MDIQNALNFCNQYLMLKILSNRTDQPLKHIPSKLQTFGNVKKKAGGKRFENPQKRSQEQTSPIKKVIEPAVMQKPKPKKKKFQGGALKKQQENPKVKSPKEQSKDQGYVPIENLLSQLIGKPEQKNNYDGFNSFAESKIGNNFNNPNKQNNFYTKYSSDSLAPREWQRTEPKQEAYWLYNQSQSRIKNLNPSQSEYLFESPTRNNGKMSNNFHVPRSRSRSILGNSQSCSNLSSTSQNRSYVDSHSKTKKKKKGQRQFYIPVSSNNQKPLGPEISCISTNNIIAKFERQILEQQNTIPKTQQQNDKSLISDTRFQTKNKNTIIKQIDDYSMIQLDNGVRESLSFVSQANILQKPIVIQMRR